MELRRSRGIGRHHRDAAHAQSGDSCAAALQHLGIAPQPSFIVCAHLRTGALVEVLPAYRSTDLGVNAVYASRKHLMPKVCVMIDVLVQALRVPLWEA